MDNIIKAYLEPSAEKVGCKFQRPRAGDAGYDLYASETVTIFPKEQVTVQTGLKLEIPTGYMGIIKDRSSMALRRIYTHAGVIDAAYRGEIGVLLDNQSGKNYHIEPGQRIAQLIIVESHTPAVEIVVEEELSNTPRGDGAFGSTGK